MATPRIFVDTSYVVALLNHRDQYHEHALALADRLEDRPLLTTDSILLEIGNALARGFRAQAVEVIGDFLSSADVEVVRLTPHLFDQAYSLFGSRMDKEWTLVDCISFLVMKEAKSTEALAFDRHFPQAGFRELR